MKLSIIKPPLARGGGFAEGKDGGVVGLIKANDNSIDAAFVVILRYYPSTASEDPQKLAGLLSGNPAAVTLTSQGAAV